MMKKILSIILLFSGIIVSYGQEEKEIKEVFQKTEKALNTIENLEYKIEYFKKYFSSEDTMHSLTNVVMMRNPADIYDPYPYFYLEGKLVHENQENSASFNRKYDKNYSYSSYSYYDTSTNAVVTTESYFDMNVWDEKIFEGNSQFNYVFNHYFLKKPFKGQYTNIKEDSNLTYVTIKTDFIKNEACYKITYFYEEIEDSNNLRMTYYIRKSDYLPIAYELSIDFQDMTQYDFYTVDYLEFNKENLDISYFEVDIEGVEEIKKEEEGSREDPKINVEEGEAALAFRTELSNGETIDLKDYKGKVVLLDFWYRGCYPCVKSIPDLVELDSMYASKGFAIIGINVQDNAK